MLHGLPTSCGGKCECSLHKQTSEAMAHEDDRPLERIYQLAIRTKLSDKTVRERQYSISGYITRRQEGFGIVVVNKNSDVVLLVWEEVPEPQDA